MINKSFELARFVRAMGGYVSAREAYAAGFRYSEGKTTIESIGSTLLKLCTQPRYTVERLDGVPARIRVTGIAAWGNGQDSREQQVAHQRAEIWRWLLSRRAAV